jgi:hypothetical protein
MPATRKMFLAAADALCGFSLSPFHACPTNLRAAAARGDARVSGHARVRQRAAPAGAASDNAEQARRTVASAAAFKRARLYSLDTAAPSMSRMTIAKMDIMLQKVAPARSGATQSAHERTPRN